MTAASLLNEASAQLGARNYSRARELLEQLRGEPEADIQLAYLLDQGLGGERSPDRAEEIYRRLAEAGDVRGMYYLGSLLLEQRKLSEALQQFERAAALGHGSSAYWAAALHDGLHGHARNAEKHAALIERAASLGHLYALRDARRLEMDKSRGSIPWIKAYARYLAVKLKGVAVGIRNPNDLRLR